MALEKSHTVKYCMYAVEVIFFQKFSSCSVKFCSNYILARTALDWTFFEERGALMKSKLMYKTVNQLAPQKLCNIFQFSSTVNGYNLRGSSTGLFIPNPRSEFF